MWRRASENSVTGCALWIADAVEGARLPCHRGAIARLGHWCKHHDLQHGDALLAWPLPYMDAERVISTPL